MRTVLSRLYNVRTVQNVDVGAGASILESVDPALDLRDDPQLCGDPHLKQSGRTYCLGKNLQGVDKVRRIH